MKCFSHPHVDAVGLCTACSRGVCTSCAVDVARGLACRDRCEHEVRRLLDQRGFSFSLPHHKEALIRRMKTGRICVVVINLILSVAFLITWYIVRQPMFVGVAGGMFAMGIFALLTGRHLTRTSQIRLCPQCGYTITGNTSGKCPECGYRVSAQGDARDGLCSVNVNTTGRAKILFAHVPRQSRTLSGCLTD